MKIMVFDVPASSGGALSVLHDFYDEYKKDTSNEYIFVISTPELEETSNVQVLRYPWIKKSWVHRLYFDYILAARLVKKHKVDEVFSLQNVRIPNVKQSQTVYVHNSLPFSEYRFGFFENKLLWVYQNLISKIIFKSIRKADRVIVQANWMKRVCTEQLGVLGEKIEVWPPQIKINNVNYFDHNPSDKVTFFYPASAVEFKNHELIIQACSDLETKSLGGYRIVLTLTGNENNHIKTLYERTKELNLPIEFVGPLTREEVFEYYSSSVLLFPSYIESSPLPLTEAKIHRSPILASDFAFSREILADYNKVTFFDAFDSKNLMFEMERYLLSFV